MDIEQAVNVEPEATVIWQWKQMPAVFSLPITASSYAKLLSTSAMKYIRANFQACLQLVLAMTY